jgi:hypothetical protein
MLCFLVHDFNNLILPSFFETHFFIDYRDPVFENGSVLVSMRLLSGMSEQRLCDNIMHRIFYMKLSEKKS